MLRTIAFSFTDTIVWARSPLTTKFDSAVYQKLTGRTMPRQVTKHVHELVKINLLIHSKFVHEDTRVSGDHINIG